MEIYPNDEFNRKLVENVHPEGWVNPEPSAPYDMVVIGAGTAGLVSAVGAGLLGLRTAIIEENYYGGDCLNFGCVPSKGLLASAKIIQKLRRSSLYGISADNLKPEFPKIMERMRRLRSEISKNDSVHRLKSLGIDVYFGKARFIGAESLSVNDKPLVFRRCIIASGARAAYIPIPGLKEAGYLTNETVFSLIELPKRLAVIGGGPIGCEMSQAFNSFGSEVHILDQGQTVLPREEKEISLFMTTKLQQEGVHMHLGIKIRRVERQGNSKRIYYEREGVELFVDADEVLLAIGRQPNVELDLESAGIEYDPKTGVKVSKYLQTTNSKIYAAGDICSVYKFTHAAEAMAKIALQNSVFPFGKKDVEKLVIPWCTYTQPEVAHVGKYKSELEKEGILYRRIHVELKEVDRYVLDGEENGFIEVLITEKGYVLGATVVAHNAGEMIGYLTFAVKEKMKISRLYNIIFPYPVSSMLIKKAAGEYMATKLTSRVKKMLGIYLWGWRLFN